MDKPWTAKLPHSLSTTCPQLHKQGLIHSAHILGGGDGMSPTFHHGYREIFGFLYPHNYFTLAREGAGTESRERGINRSAAFWREDLCRESP